MSLNPVNADERQTPRDKYAGQAAPGAAAGRATHQQNVQSIPAHAAQHDAFEAPAAATHAGPPGGPPPGGPPGGPPAAAGTDGADRPHRPWSQNIADWLAAASWAGTASAPAVLVGAVPLLLPLLKLSTFSWPMAMGAVLAATAGMWAANSAGVWLAIALANRRATPDAAAGLAAAGQNAFAAPAPAGAQPTVPPSANVDHEGQATSLAELLAPAGAGGALVERTPRRDQDRTDVRAPGLEALARAEGNHGGMRIYMPTAPHARAPDAYARHARNARDRHEFLQLFQADGSGFNALGTYGNSAAYTLWVTTVLDGLSVLTADYFWPWLRGEALAGAFFGAWNGFQMLGGEAGFAHPLLPGGLRINGSGNRVQAESHSLQPKDAAQDGTLSRFGASATHTSGWGGALNGAFRLGLSSLRPAAFARGDRAHRSHRHRERQLDLAAAQDFQAAERARSSPFGWLRGWWPGTRSAPTAAPSFFREAMASASLRQTEEVTHGLLVAGGLPSLRKTAAGAFAAHHDVHQLRDVLSLEQVDANAVREAGEHLLLTYRMRDVDSARWFFSFTGGAGFDVGTGQFHELSYKLRLRPSEALAPSIAALEQALKQVHSAPEASRQEARAAIVALREHVLPNVQGAESLTQDDGTTLGRDIGMRTVPLLASEYWRSRAPSGFSFGAVDHRRSISFDSGNFALGADAEPADQASGLQAWAGRVTHSDSFGPFGSRNTSLWVSVDPSLAEPARRSVSFEALWKVSFADQWDYRNYILEPVERAFDLPDRALGSSGQGSWRTERTVRLQRTWTLEECGVAGFDWDLFGGHLLGRGEQAVGPLPPHDDKDESARTAPARMRKFFEQERPNAAAANALRNAFRQFLDAQGMEALARVAKASGVRAPAAGTEAEWLAPLRSWNVSVTSDEYEQPLTAYAAAKLDPSRNDARERQHVLERRLEATAGLMAREPLASKAIKQARIARLREPRRLLQASPL